MSDDENVTAKLVPEGERLDVLPRLFGRAMVRVESSVYDWMGRLCKQYGGGYWHFYTLSNGGFYMAPSTKERLRIQVEGNGFDRAMSADAAGVVTVLFSFGALASNGDQPFVDLYHHLRAFALHHTECEAILAAID